MGAYTLNTVASSDFYDNSYLVKGGEVDSAYSSPASSAEQGTASELRDKSSYETQTVSVSTAFNPETSRTRPDHIFSSTDHVLFYVDMKLIANASPRAFQSSIVASPTYEGLPGAMTVVFIQESSSVLNVILHILYGMSCARFIPIFETLVDAVNRMPFYDISPTAHITTFSHIFTALRAFAPIYPLELYTFAGHHRLHDLAVAASSHLLSCPLTSLSDEAAQCMGPLYLKRLFDLHLDRFHSLRDMLACPPYPHPQTDECSFSDQADLTRAWALASSQLAWDARADLSPQSIRLVFRPLIEELTCQHCRECMDTKLRDIVIKWVSIKRTI